MDSVLPMNEFSHWELLQPSPVTLIDSDTSFDERDSGKFIRTNYFSLDALDPYGEDLDDNNSAESDNPSWIDPGNPLDRGTAEFWSEEDSDGRIPEDEDKKAEEMVGQKVEKVADLGNFCADSSGVGADTEKIIDFVENSDLGLEGNVILHDDTGEEKRENQVIGKGREFSNCDSVKSSGEIEKSCLVWWKMPMELLKYCVFKMSPVWTISAAAAVLSFLILRRRMYKMKKKTRGMEIEVTVDAKKASQVMSRAARLNEAFWVVKRVPMIRPSLPADGVTTWPVMANLR